jgi:polyhydroxyalkanoate synthesis regulator protein
VVPQFLAASFEMLRDSQSKMLEKFGTMPNPMVGVPGFEAMQRQQEAFLKSMMGGWTAGATGPAPGDAATEDDKDAELRKIKQQLADLQSKLSNL